MADGPWGFGGVCASDSAACVAAVFFDVSCKGSFLVSTEYAPYYM